MRIVILLSSIILMAAVLGVAIPSLIHPDYSVKDGNEAVITSDKDELRSYIETEEAPTAAEFSLPAMITSPEPVTTCNKNNEDTTADVIVVDLQSASVSLEIAAPAVTLNETAAITCNSSISSAISEPEIKIDAGAVSATAGEKVTIAGENGTSNTGSCIAANSTAVAENGATVIEQHHVVSSSPGYSGIASSTAAATSGVHSSATAVSQASVKGSGRAVSQATAIAH